MTTTTTTCVTSPPCPSLVTETTKAAIRTHDNNNNASVSIHSNNNNSNSNIDDNDNTKKSKSKSTIEMTISTTSIPKIDARKLAVRDPSTMTLLRGAIVNPGFLIVTHTTITRSDVRYVMDTFRQFFHQPSSVKGRVSMARTASNRGWGAPHSEKVNPTASADSKEYFDVGYELPSTTTATTATTTTNHVVLQTSWNANYYYAPNQWPSVPSDFRNVILSYYTQACTVAMDVLRAIASVIGQDETYFDDAFTHPMALLRGNYYKQRESSSCSEEKDEEDEFGIAAHTDYGCLTLLATDGTPGLEVQVTSSSSSSTCCCDDNDNDDGNNHCRHIWIPVQAEMGEFVVNFGEMLQLWSNGKVRATPHRVVRRRMDDDDGACHGQERISVPLFFNPNHDTNVAPPPSSLSTNEKDDDSPGVILAGPYLSKRFSETYLHLQQQANGT